VSQRLGSGVVPLSGQRPYFINTDGDKAILEISFSTCPGTGIAVPLATSGLVIAQGFGGNHFRGTQLQEA